MPWLRNASVSAVGFNARQPRVVSATAGERELEDAQVVKCWNTRLSNQVASQRNEEFRASAIRLNLRRGSRFDCWIDTANMPTGGSSGNAPSDIIVSCFSRGADEASCGVHRLLRGRSVFAARHLPPGWRRRELRTRTFGP